MRKKLLIAAAIMVLLFALLSPKKNKINKKVPTLLAQDKDRETLVRIIGINLSGISMPNYT